MHHIVGTPALVPIRHLARLDGRQARRTHPRARQYAGTLYEGWRGHDGDRMTQTLPPGFKEQGNVEHHKRPLAPCLLAQEPPCRRACRRVQDSLQAAQRRHVTEDARAKLSPVDSGVGNNAGKGRRDSGNSRPTGSEQSMHRLIGVVHGDTKPA